MNESEIELWFVYTRESYIKAMKEFEKAFPEPLWKRVRGWILQTIFIVFGVLPGLYYLWLYLLGIPIFQIVDTWVILVYGLILLIIIWDLANWLRHRFWPSAGDYDKDERWKDERHWITNDSGIQLETSVSQSNIKWANFNSVLESPSAYLFTYGTKENPQWLYLPKYAFNSAQQEELFKSILKRSIEFREMRKIIL